VSKLQSEFYQLFVSAFQFVFLGLKITKIVPTRWAAQQQHLLWRLSLMFAEPVFTTITDRKK